MSLKSWGSTLAELGRGIARAANQAGIDFERASLEGQIIMARDGYMTVPCSGLSTNSHRSMPVVIPIREDQREAIARGFEKQLQQFNTEHPESAL